MSDADFHRRLATHAGYNLGAQIGEGNFKFCYAATKSGKDVAFKVLKPNAAIARTQRELSAMLSCSHPNIATCVDSGEATIDGRRLEYVVEPLFAKGSLADKLKRGTMTHVDVLALGSQMIAAVGHLQERDLVHRDIKPENIMYSEQDVPLLTDFGIVRSLGEPSLTDSAYLHGPGTPTFMPAEQYHNQKAMIDWRADQFALGVTLGMCALGKHPFGTSLRERVDNIAARKEPQPAFVAAAGTFGLPVLAKMVNPYPIGRYTDVATLLKEWNQQIA